MKNRNPRKDSHRELSALGRVLPHRELSALGRVLPHRELSAHGRVHAHRELSALRRVNINGRGVGRSFMNQGEQLRRSWQEERSKRI